MISTGSNTLAPLIYGTTCSGLRVAALPKRAMRNSHFVSSKRHSLIGRTLKFITAALVVNAAGKLAFISTAISAVGTNTFNQSMQLTPSHTAFTFHHD